jgi:MFS family permease
MNQEKLNANIWKLYLIKSLRSFMLFTPVIVLFFQENGLSMQQVFLLQALFSVAVISLEVPTGYFSDIFGRKKSIIIGGILATMGFAIYSQSYTFWGFLLAEITLGFGISFVSGADSAMLYDTLLEKGRELEYQKREGRGQGIGMLSESLASVLGGLLALISLRFPLYCDVAITFLVIPVALTLMEPKIQRAKKTESSLKSIWGLIKFSLHDHKEVKWLIIYSASVAASTLTMFWFIQPYLLAMDVPLGFFGVILAGLLLTAAFFSWNAHKIEKILGKKKSLILLIILPVLGYLLLSSLWFVWSGVFILFFFITRGLNNPITLDYINGLIPSDIRATVLSVKNLVGRVMFSVIGPLVGWVSDVFSLKAALLSSGTIFLILGLISLAFMRKHRALE